MTTEADNTTAGPYAGNDVTQTFTFSFTLGSADTVQVWETDDAGDVTLLTVDVDYTLDKATGEVTLTTPLPTGYELFITSVYSPAQSTSFSSFGTFNPAVHERAFDRAFQLINEIRDWFTRRVLKFPESYQPGVGETLEIPTPDAGKILGWDETNNLQNIDLSVEIEGQIDTAITTYDTDVVSPREDAKILAALGTGGGDVLLTQLLAFRTLNTNGIGNTDLPSIISNTTALQAVLTDTDNGQIVSTNDIVIGDMLVMDQVSVNTGSAIIKGHGDGGLLYGNPVASWSSNSNSETFTRDINVVGDGNSGNLLTEYARRHGVVIYNDRSPQNRATVKAYACDIGVLVKGDCEKKTIDVHAAYCRTAYEEQIGSDSSGSDSPDELKVTITATRCLAWYRTEGEVSSDVTFNVESQITDTVNPQLWSVYGANGKSVSLGGEMRGINGNGMWISRTTADSRQLDAEGNPILFNANIVTADRSNYDFGSNRILYVAGVPQIVDANGDTIPNDGPGQPHVYNFRGQLVDYADYASPVAYDTYADTVVFKNMKLIQVRRGTGVVIHRMQRVHGTLEIYQHETVTPVHGVDAAALAIGRVGNLGGFKAVINKCMGMYGLMIGYDSTDSGNTTGDDFTCSNVDVHATIEMGDLYSGGAPVGAKAIYFKHAVNMNVICDALTGDIGAQATSSAVNCSVTVPVAWVKSGATVTNCPDVTIIVDGTLTETEMNNITWKDDVKAVVVKRVLERDMGATYSSQLSQGTIPGGGRWKLNGDIVVDKHEIESYSSPINNMYKRAGVKVGTFDGSTYTVYVASGGKVDSVWQDMKSGGANVTPAYQSETTAYGAAGVTAGAASLSGAELLAVDTMFYKIKKAYSFSGFNYDTPLNLTTKIKRLYLLSASDPLRSVLNAAEPWDVADTLTVNGDASHLPYYGWSANPFTGGNLLMNTNPTSITGVDGDDMTMGFYVGEFFSSYASDDTEQDIRDTNLGNIRMRGRASNGSYVRMSTAVSLQASTASSPANPPRLVTGIRRITTEQEIWINGNLSASETIDATIETTAPIEISRAARQLSVFFVAPALTAAQMVLVADALDTYNTMMNAIDPM